MIGPLEFELRTSRYANRSIADTKLIPIGITAGNPRFRLSYRLATNLRLLAPSRAWFDLADDEFERHYLHKLDEQGVDMIAAELRETFETHRTSEHDGLVLLCFEDLAVPGAFCHRRLFASWFERETGQPVPELMSAEAI